MQFSIIIPVYNVEPYICQCVDSILNQSFLDFELILVDDGSPDLCPAICDQYAEKDSRVIVVHQRNGGLSDARNAGLKIANGKYVVFIDADDFWDGDECLSSIYAASENEPDVILFWPKKLFNESGIFSCDGKSFQCINAPWDCPGELLLQLIQHELFRCSAWARSVKRSLLIDNEIYFMKGLLSEDIPWYMQIILHAKRYAYVDQDFYVYRQREGSITKSFALKNLCDFIYVIRNCVERVQRQEILHDLKIVSLSYLAKEYSQLLLVYAQINDSNKSKYKKEIISYDWLLKYAISKRPKLVRFAYKHLGFEATTMVMRLFCFLKGKKRFGGSPTASFFDNQGMA